MPSAVGWLLLLASAGVVAGIPTDAVTKRLNDAPRPAEGSGLRTVEREIKDLGKVRGFVETTRTGTRDVDCFLGIPFVVKPARFEYPTNFYPPWDDVREATERARMCPQGKFYPEDLYADMANSLAWDGGRVESRSVKKREDGDGDTDKEEEEEVEDDGTLEDCLTLDIYTPSTATETSELPVLLFLHGGAFVRGSARSARPDFILDHEDLELVIVSAQYRLGALGFLSAGGTQDAGIGNAALHDQKWALDWTIKYISSFGGNPNKIVVGGVSAGGATSGLLYVSPLTNKYLAGALLFSGCSVSPWTIDPNPRSSTRGVAMYTECEAEATAAAEAEEGEYWGTGDHDATLKAEDNLLDCLKTVPLEELLNATWTWAKFEKSNNRLGMGTTIPVVDGADRFLPKRPIDIMLTDPDFKPLPIIVGVTREEGLYLEVQIEGFYIIMNGYENDTKMLSEEIGDIILKFTGLDDQLFMLGKAVQKLYFREDQLGNYDLMKDGVIDLSGAAFFKGPAHSMVQTNTKLGGKSWLYTFDYTSSKEQDDARTNGRRSRINHGADQAFIFPSRDDDFYYSTEDYEMVVRFSRMVATFVVTQQPTPNGQTTIEGADWPPLTNEENDLYLSIGHGDWVTKRGFAQEFHATNNRSSAAGLSLLAAFAATVIAFTSLLNHSRP